CRWGELWPWRSSALLPEQFVEYRVDVGGPGDVLHGKAVGKAGLDAGVGLPQGVLAGLGDLDVGVVLGEGYQLLHQRDAVTVVVGPVIPVRGLGTVDVPLARRVAGLADGLHQLERARHHGAAGLPGVEEFLLVHLLGAGVVAQEHHLDFFVIAGQKQVKQDEEAFGEILGALIHGARHIHHAEHHRLGAGYRHLFVAPVADVEVVDERHRLDATLELRDAGAQVVAPLPGEAVVALPEGFEFRFEFLHLTALAGGEGDAPGRCRAHGAGNIDIAGVARRTETGAAGLEFLDARQLAFGEVGQRHVLEQKVEKFLLADFEHEIVEAFPVRTAAAARAAGAALGAWHGVAGDEFPVARQYMGDPTALAVAEQGFVGVPGGDADLLAPLGVGDAAVAQVVLHRFADLRPVPLDKALAVDGALVLAVESSVDQVGHGRSIQTSVCWPLVRRLISDAQAALR